MLSYRHHYHAGNFADILKHFSLYLILNYYNKKNKPYWYIDTHSGQGLYDLNSEYSLKLLEYKNGIEKLVNFNNNFSLQRDLKNFLKNIFHENIYYGSPFLAALMGRITDKILLFELHKQEYINLVTNFNNYHFKSKIIIKKEDGFNGLVKFLPPKIKRSIILIDPSYEEDIQYKTL